MTDQPAHDSLTTQPFWKVQTVFDPEGTGKDFAYTIGLHTRGIPELHIWARPTLGEDPGHDWMLSTNDRIFLLDELAQLFLDGRLEVGAEVTREYDGGMATLTFRVDPAGDKQELEAYGVPPDADVLPIPWSLCRVPEGQLTPLTEDAEEQARASYSAILQDLAPWPRAPLGWALPAIPTFEIDQRFGPLTPVVLARAAQLWKADDDAITSCCTQQPRPRSAGDCPPRRPSRSRWLDLSGGVTVWRRYRTRSTTWSQASPSDRRRSVGGGQSWPVPTPSGGGSRTRPAAPGCSGPSPGCSTTS